MSLVRADLAKLPSYVPGRRPADVADAAGNLLPPVRLASNEVPYGPLPGVVDAIAHAAADAHRYPDAGSVELRGRLAASYGLDPDQVATGCGSVALAEQLVRATTFTGDEVIYSWRSFEAYPIVVGGHSAVAVPVPNTAEHGHDLAAMRAAVTDRTRLVFVCNPNNPTGTAIRGGELAEFVDSMPADVLVVVDEAYREFVTDPDVPDGLDFARGRENVVVLRTLSKAWGMAGLRVGWLAATPHVADTVRKIVTTFSVSSLAQAAALAALDQRDEMRRRCDLVIAERPRILEAVRKLGFETPDSQANFVWLPAADATSQIVATCDRHGVIVRGFAGEGIRVTVGTPEENDRFLAALADAV
ncbi:histidinol-phosphate transaminase [Fodinicola feengrottensis]|uniref:Aromatic amino acid aminotransferase n=1 Tax=Fodinicola feengrottensis TaxID=435914 RepID=A0ABN2IGV1_9ACTN